MKNVAKVLLMLSNLIVSLSTMANITNGDNETTSFDVGGTIQPQCKVKARNLNRAIGLDLSSATRQKTANIQIWCNTGQSQATASYSSLNGGQLVNEAGQKIPYLMQIPNTVGDVSLSQTQTVSQRTGTGIAGDHKGRVVKITPQVNGFEYAGIYRDTIEVTVSPN
ncbi:MAG: spore coat protein U domain-containing protein [Aestuariibacter sp.]